MSSQNLPSLQGQFQVVRRENPNAKRDFTLGWGAKNEGIQPGDNINGIILGFELNDYKKKNIIIKSFNHNMQRVKIFGCTSIESELHSDQAGTQLVWNPGDTIRVTYIKTYIGTKGLGTGKPISIFNIDEIVGYQLTQEDINDIQEFQTAQLKKQPLQTYKVPLQGLQGQPIQQGYNSYAQPAQMATQHANVAQQPYAAPQAVYTPPVNSYAQPTQKARFNKTASDDSFDI